MTHLIKHTTAVLLLSVGLCTTLVQAQTTKPRVVNDPDARRGDTYLFQRTGDTLVSTARRLGRYEIIIRTRAEPYKGNPELELKIGDKTVRRTISTRNYTNVSFGTYDLSNTPISLTFTNDLWQGRGKDRNVAVDVITYRVRNNAPVPVETPVEAPVPPPMAADTVFKTAASTSRFLTMATFGPTTSDVNQLTGTNASDWIQAEFAKPRSPFLSTVINYYNLGETRPMMLADGFDQGATTFTFWRNVVNGSDQLRQRMAFALSQILVISNGSGGLNGIFPHTGGYYQDLLIEHAFGNYRDLLEAVTYSPAMGEYLTYIGNEKADPATGRVPDENYAREILQLFTIGLVQLNADGTPVLDDQGEPIELYDNDDITELAKVFTGLNNPVLEYSSGRDLARGRNRIVEALQQPLLMNNATHSQASKTFLGTTIPANTSGEETIDLALDAIMSHPNVGPFIGKQLIQRFTTSNPDKDYVKRVAQAFDRGTYNLPDGTRVGEGRKGDLKATIAAVLFDPDAVMTQALQDVKFGKLREPLLRLTHFMRAFDTDMQTPEYVRALFDTASISSLGQHPYRSPSVFNFYRPGYVAPGSLSAAQGLVAPELQISNASSTPGYMNLLSYGAFQQQRERFNDMRTVFSAFRAPFDETRAKATFIPDYTRLLPLADDSKALVDTLNRLLVYGSMNDSTRNEIINTLDTFPRSGLDTQAGREDLIGYAVLMVMSSPDYLVQR